MEALFLLTFMMGFLFASQGEVEKDIDVHLEKTVGLGKVENLVLCL